MLSRDLMNGKAEIYRLFCIVRIFECFKWDAFKTILYMKNEILLELLNFCGSLHFILNK